MPIYEYRCDNCGHELETIQKMSDAPLTHCPACDQETLRKKVSAAGFRLKGGGWYETDFKSDKKRNVAGDEKAAGGDKDGGGKDGKAADKAGSAGTADSGSGGAAAKSSESKSSGDSGKSSGEGKGSGSKAKPKSAE